ncbi:MAG: hypothetical protein K1W21_03995 [Oscillospiraceae bacterium]
MIQWLEVRARAYARIQAEPRTVKAALSQKEGANRMKRVFSIVLAFTLMILLGISPVTAANEVFVKGINEDELFAVLDTYESYKESLGLSDIDFTTLRIGEMIHI